MDDIIQVRLADGRTVIAKAWPAEHQYPSISPAHYTEVASVPDSNKVGPVAKVFGWVPVLEEDEDGA